MYEKLKVGVWYKRPTEKEMAHAKAVYDRFVACLKEHYGAAYGSDQLHTAPSLAEFLLEDIDFRCIDCFTWERGVLVRAKGGTELGMTAGWRLCGFSHPVWRVVVAFASGERTVMADEIDKADIPPEVLDYVKSTLQERVHGKVNEAFKEG